MKFKIGDVVRYDYGKTALIKIDVDYSNNYKCNNYGYRLYGTHVLGGVVGAYENDCKLATKEEKDFYETSKRVK